MPPAPHPDVLRTASGPGTGLGMRRCGAQLGPHISRPCHCRGLEQRLYHLPVSLRDPCEGKCLLLPPRPSRWPCGQGSSPPRNARPAAFLSCSVILAGAEIPASGCRDRIQGNPVPYPISYTAGFGSGSDPGPPNVPPNKPTLSQTAPLRLTTSWYPCAVQAARGGTPTPRCSRRIRRVTTQGRALRAGVPELDDMNAVTTVGRPSWRA